MQKNLIKFSLGVGFLVIMMAFQNCSVYQSSGRKYLDEEGLDLTNSSFAVSEKASQSGNNLIKVAENTCEQYLPTRVVDIWSEGIASVRSFVNLESDELSCMYSISDSKNKMDHIQCQISGARIDNGNFPQQDDIDIYSGAVGNIIARELDAGELCLDISPKGGVLGAHCCVTKLGSSPLSDKKAAELGLEILKNMR